MIDIRKSSDSNLDRRRNYRGTTLYYAVHFDV